VVKGLHTRRRKTDLSRTTIVNRFISISTGQSASTVPMHGMMSSLPLVRGALTSCVAILGASGSLNEGGVQEWQGEEQRTAEGSGSCARGWACLNLNQSAVGRRIPVAPSICVVMGCRVLLPLRLREFRLLPRQPACCPLRSLSSS
jgi:hypothetical protein